MQSFDNSGAAHRSTERARAIVVRGTFMAIAVLIGLTAFACSGDAPHEPAVSETRIVSDAARLNAEQGDALSSLRLQARFAGQMHDAAMDVVLASIREHRRGRRPLPRPGSPQFCAVFERAGDAAMTLGDQNRGVVRSRMERSVEVRRHPVLASCIREMSVLGSVAGSRIMAAMQESEAEPTGVYVSYLDDMEGAVQSSDGTPNSVQQRVDAVLTAAASAGVPEGDLLALAGVASVAVASAAEWNAYDWNTGDSGGKCDGCDPMTMFPQVRIDPRVTYVIAADINGCITAIADWESIRKLFRPGGWKAVVAECGYFGAMKSAAAVWDLM